MNNQRRKQCKEKLSSGSYTPVQFLGNISHSIGNPTSLEETSFSDDSDINEESTESVPSMSTTRISTWILCLAGTQIVALTV